MISAFNHVYWNRKTRFLLESDTYDTWVLFAVEDGAFRFRIGRTEGLAESGSVVACPPGVPFRRSALSPVSFHFLRLAFEDAAPPSLREGLLRVANRPRLASDLALLHGLADDASADGQAAIRHLIEDMLLFCFRDRSSDPVPAPGSSDPLMASAAAWIRSRAHEKPFSVRQAAEFAGLTPVQFSRRFQAAFRTTPIRYATDCRLQLAKELLSDTNLTIERIAVRCGYENAFYLSRVFKKHLQTSPSAYRKACQV